jgi:hypothetical protein
LGGNWVASRKIGGAVPVVLYLAGGLGAIRRGGRRVGYRITLRGPFPGFRVEEGAGGDRNGQHMYAAVVKVVSSIIGLSTRGGCRWFPGRQIEISMVYLPRAGSSMKDGEERIRKKKRGERIQNQDENSD